MDIGLIGVNSALTISAIGSALGMGAAGSAAIGAWKRCYMQGKPAPFLLIVFVSAPLTQIIYGYILMNTLYEVMMQTNPWLLLGAGLGGGFAIAVSGFAQGKARNLVLFFFALPFSISLNSSSDRNFPYWILLEKGRQFLYSKSEFSKSNLTHAINYLQEALLRKGVYPEASYYLSVAYGMSGNSVLEKLNLYKSFEDKDYLLDGSFEKKILFSLAKMAELENNYVDTIDYLNDILNKFSTKKDYYNYHDYSQSENSTSNDKFNVSFYLTSSKRSFWY